MGTFTIYAPSSATDGGTARIFVSAGDVEITHTVTFGAATPVEGEMVDVDDADQRASRSSTPQVRSIVGERGMLTAGAEGYLIIGINTCCCSTLAESTRSWLAA